MRPFDSFIYHVFPLGACGAPAENDLVSEPVHRLSELTGRLDHVVGLGANTVLLGPVWESAAHGYDTLDLFTVDRRLGAIDDLRAFAEAVHQRDMNLMLDTVLNHVARGFWAFQDVVAKGRDSRFLDWFHIDPASARRRATPSTTRAGPATTSWSSSTSATPGSASTCSLR